ncbi:MAG: glycosyltransferase [Caulobacteraceae bacterium]|nr:MAG: glycosyltransferase [Caulobacteraceae bacterium]
MTAFLHILPEDGLGGAEIAARAAATAAPERITIAVLAGPPAAPHAENVIALGGRHPFSPLAAWRAGRLARGYEVAVFSLWKSALAMLATALLSPGTRRVLFLHSDRRVHLPDTLATWLGGLLAHEVWADCQRSLDGVAGLTRALTPTRVISFRLGRMAPTRRTTPRPRFIFWGRLNALKRIERAIDLFARLARDRPEARFLLIGPDAGSEAALRAQVASLGLDDRITFAGVRSLDEIAALSADYDIFLQLSEQEGAAMSLIEAMQLGLVPVVTPVGEMDAYVRPMETGVIYRSPEQAAADVARILDDPALFARISAAAVDHWAGGRLYQDDVAAAAEALAATAQAGRKR